MRIPKGYWCPVLHAHLPYVRHPEYPDFLEEDWFYEGLTETYLPLLAIFENLAAEGIHFRVTMTITPTLAGMMSDELLMGRYRERLVKLSELSLKEVERLKDDHDFLRTAEMYKNILADCRRLMDKYRGRILAGFRNLQDSGHIEIITCCATHGFLPLMTHRDAIAAQIRIAKRDYKRHFGRDPRGIWLAECAYSGGIEEILRDEGIRFFFVEAHGILYAEPRPKYGIFAPLYCPGGVACFGRDQESAHQVWSSEIGYPGDPSYREFYRDVGYDLDYDYIKPYLHEDGVRRNVGIKYYRVTGKVPLDGKMPYDPARAREQAATHAGNFLFNRTKQTEHISSVIDRRPIVVSPFDAELFGHWWFEGPMFLDYLFRKIHYDQNVIKCITPTEYLDIYPKNQIARPAASSWGDKGYFEVWLNGSNDWIYRHLHKAEERMTQTARLNRQAAGLTRRSINQMARELMLAQSSDWAFIMTTGTMVEYAMKRTVGHIRRFTKLYEQVRDRSIDGAYVAELERRDNIFPDIDYRAYL
ncbi:MAG: DUF1957 domain-containing protein [Endomicrobiia bacterium]|nr:DUF1957 domain-containing protein [Endomicrobiia bacterium]